MVNPSTKLYVQLQPDDAGIEHLLSVQKTLGGDARPVRKGSLHLTILHIGLVSKLTDSLRPYTTVPDADILRALDSLVDRLSGSITTLGFSGCSLRPIGYDFFGASGSTYVVRYENPAALCSLHAACLGHLREFITEAGVSDVQAYMEQDTNLHYALTLKPHVALARSYHGTGSAAQLQPMTFRQMPIVY
jgi:hypothetical protein